MSPSTPSFLPINPPNHAYPFTKGQKYDTMTSLGLGMLTFFFFLIVFLVCYHSWFKSVDLQVNTIIKN